MHWAYAVLGWGGYWGWDPVENASLMPWLTGTAFLHSVMMQEKRGMMKQWNVWLIFSTFMLSILGTLLTRAGLVSSVHAFAQSSIGRWFVTFPGDHHGGLPVHLHSEPGPSEVGSSHRVAGEPRIELPVQQPGAAGGLLHDPVGNAVSVLSEYIEGTKTTVGAPFYNHIAVPIGVFLLLLTGVGPLLAWRASLLPQLAQNLLWPAIASARGCRCACWRLAHRSGAV